MADLRLARCAVIVAVLCLAGAARACDDLADGPADRVAAVLDGDTVKLDSGIVVRLGGVLAPLGAGRKGGVAEPMAAVAKSALAKLVLGQPVRLGLDDEETDRYGRMEAQLFVDAPGGVWVQQVLVAGGMARVYALPKGRRCLGELLAAEAGARANGLGIWGDPYYSVRDAAADPAALLALAGHYELIEGEVVGTGETRDRSYLDFGRVWKEDFTATVDAKVKKLFVAAGIDPLTLKGRRVRIRGWLESRDGPLIELGLPEQIEVLDSK